MRKGMMLSLLLTAALQVLPALTYASPASDRCIESLKAEDFEEAAIIGMAAVRKDPKNATANLCLAKALSETGKYQEALEYFQAGEAVAEDGTDVSFAAAGMAECYYELGNMMEAISQGQRALALDRDLKDTESIGSGLHFLGYIYSEIGSPDKARDLLEESLLYETDDQQMGARFSTLAAIYAELGDDRCVTFSRKAIRLQERAGDARGVAITHLKLGDQYRKFGMLKEALEELETGLVGVAREEDPLWAGIGLMYFARLLEDANAIEDARQVMEASLLIFQHIGANKQIEAANASLREMNKKARLQF